VPPNEKESAHLAAVALGRLGGKMGGKARAGKLTPVQRREMQIAPAAQCLRRLLTTLLCPYRFKDG
jgi:hypothetical protein